MIRKKRQTFLPDISKSSSNLIQTIHLLPGFSELMKKNGLDLPLLEGKLDYQHSKNLAAPSENTAPLDIYNERVSDRNISQAVIEAQNFD